SIYHGLLWVILWLLSLVLLKWFMFFSLGSWLLFLTSSPFIPQPPPKALHLPWQNWLGRLLQLNLRANPSLPAWYRDWKTKIPPSGSRRVCLHRGHWKIW